MNRSDIKIKTKIGALIVLGIFAMLILSTIVLAQSWGTGGSDIVSYPIIIDSDGSSTDEVFAVLKDDSDPTQATELFRVQENGRVGIGDTSPDFKLEVTGSSGSGYFGVTTSTDGDIFIIDSSGDVGIGTTTPGTRLHVMTSGVDNHIRVQRVNQNPKMDLISGGSWVGIDAISTSSELFSIFNDGTAVFHIRENNNVGIGTTSPDYKLQVDGVIAPETTDQDLGTTALRWDLYANAINADGLGTGTDDTVLILDSSSQVTTDEIDTRVWGATLVDGSGSAGHVSYWSDADTITYDNGQFYWDAANDRLGIGTISPDGSLDIEETGAGTANIDILHLTNAANDPFDMTGTETSILFNQYYYDAVTPQEVDAGRITVGTESHWTGIAASQDSYMAFHTGTGGNVREVVRISSNGNVAADRFVARTGASAVELADEDGTDGMKVENTPNYENIWIGDYSVSSVNFKGIYMDATLQTTSIGTVDTSSRLVVASKDSADDALRLLGPDGEATAYGARLNFGSLDGVYIEEDADDKLYIYADDRIGLMGSNVGIGQTTPLAKLEVLDATGNPQLRLTYTDATSYVDFEIDTNSDLEIKPSAYGIIKLKPTLDSTDFFQVLDADGAGDPVLNVDSTNERVGIGTASPSTELHVDGDIRQKVTTLNLNNPPSDSSLDTWFGTPASNGDGYTAYYKDSDSNNFYQIVAVGTQWYIFQAALAT